MNITKKHENTMKNTIQHNHYKNQTNNTRLTQFRKQTNFSGNGARQTIVGEVQFLCRMKNDKQA
jgi:hypothetical protein